MQNLEEYIKSVLKALENPIKDKPLTDFEQGAILGRYKLAVAIKELLQTK